MNKSRIFCILLCSLLIVLTVSCVSAVSVDDLKIPSEFVEVSDGYYQSSIDSDYCFYVGELSLNEDLFATDESSMYGVSKLDDDIYVYIDGMLVSSGVQEIVELDEGKYVVSIFNDNLISDPDDSSDVLLMESYHQDLIKFNEDNGLTPIEY